MGDVTQSQEAASWVQAGGLLAFASAVYWEIRQIRPFMRKISEALAVLRDREGVPDSEMKYPNTPRQRNPYKRKQTGPFTKVDEGED